MDSTTSSPGCLQDDHGLRESYEQPVLEDASGEQEVRECGGRDGGLNAPGPDQSENPDNSAMVIDSSAVDEGIVGSLKASGQDQSENSNNTTMAVHNSAHNQNGLATGQSQPNFHVPNGWKLCANPFIQPNAIIGGSYPSPSGAYTYQNTGTTVHGLSNNASADQALSSSVATPANTGSSSRIPVSPGATNHGKAHARVQYPPSKYGFGPVLVAKNMIEKGDELKIPLNLGANLTLPNPDYVIMEYLGRNREGKNATASDWILRTSPSVNCTAKGPKSFIKILNDNGIVGYNTRNLSATAEVVRNGRSLGTITEMKARANGG